MKIRLLFLLALALPFARAFADGPILYLTDLEGDYDKLVDFVGKSNGQLSLDADGKLQIKAGVTFVYGGDAVDHGPGSQKIVAALVDCKKRMAREGRPEAMVLIAGNRDINKIRMQSELSDEAMAAEIPEKVKEYLGGKENTRVNRLKFMLETTMGAKQAFEFRRGELKAAGKPSGDNDVLESYRTDIAPGGVFREFLELSQLAYRRGNVLVVHGGITEQNYLKVPGPDGTLKEVTSLDAMVDGLNKWYKAQLKELAETGKAPALVAYQARKPGVMENQDSVVYGHYSDASGNPVLPPRWIFEALKRAGIDWVFSGHRPYGESASILRGPIIGDSPINFVIADNSHTPTRSSNYVALSADGAKLSVSGRTHLNEKGPEMEVAFEVDRADTLSPIGKRTADGFLVRAKLADGRFLIVRTHPDYTRTEKIVSAAELAKMALRTPVNPVAAGIPCPIGWLSPKP